MKTKVALVVLSVVAAAIMLGTICQLALADLLMPPYGLLQGTVNDVYTSRPIAGATITVTSFSGQTFSLNTNATGQYSLDLDQSLSPLNVTASAYGHSSASMLTWIREREVSIRDFSLLQKPDPSPDVLWGSLLTSATLIVVFCYLIFVICYLAALRRGDIRARTTYELLFGEDTTNTTRHGMIDKANHPIANHPE